MSQVLPQNLRVSCSLKLSLCFREFLLGSVISEWIYLKVRKGDALMTVIWECPWSLQSSALFNVPAQTILSPNISEFKFHPPYYRCRSPFVGLFYNSGPDLQITLGPFSNIFSLNSPLISCPKKQRRCMKLDPKWKWAILCAPNLAKLNIRDWAF